jgi:hypothetical protein
MQLHLNALWQRSPKYTMENSSTNVAGKTGYPHVEDWKLDPCLSLGSKINIKQIEVLNIRPETLKQLKAVVGNTLEHIGIGNDFLSRHPCSATKSKNEKWGRIKLKSFCIAQESFCTTTEWEKIFASYSSDKGLISRIYRKLRQLNPKGINIQWRNGPMNWIGNFQKKK